MLFVAVAGVCHVADLGGIELREDELESRLVRGKLVLMTT
jgi:hypothetical protein